MGKINEYDKIVMKNKKKRENIKIEEIYTKICIQKKILEWNLQLSKANWCQRKRWHHLPHVTHIATLRVGYY